MSSMRNAKDVLKGKILSVGKSSGNVKYFQSNTE